MPRTATEQIFCRPKDNKLTDKYKLLPGNLSGKGWVRNQEKRWTSKGRKGNEEEREKFQAIYWRT